MIVYYAVGGGLGHVTRARRVLDALRIEDAVIVASVKADGRVTGRYPLLDSIPGDAERIIVDAFPLGIRGELAGIGVPLDYVARLLRWDEYRRCVPDPLPRFGTMYVVEEVTHSVLSERVVELSLQIDDRSSNSEYRIENEEFLIRNSEFAIRNSYWLVVHSGPEEEVRELIAYAEELQRIEGDRSEIVVATQCDIEGRVDVIPATPLYAQAKRIVSAAGFNVMLETEPWRDKHHVVPMPRRFDDQFARAARRRRYDASSRICAAR
jgi:hypothetical protein